MKKSILLASTLMASAALCMLSIPAYAADKSADASKAEKKANADEGKEIVVTGVFKATAIERTPISINVVTAQQISQHAAVSAADLLKNVPGVFVNSSLGEIRNVVFSRGVSANSLDAAGGYYYVSLQEDGLPVELQTATNFGPDYFLRPDLNLGRLEALRGGTASITGPNAPGGIFNYISKTGKSNPGVEVQAKFGLEGNGQNPYYRADAYAGGQMGNGLYYSIGGFYRTDRGAHDPGYAHNKGGQIHGNILYDYGSGSLLFSAKYLDDHNGWFEFTPAIGGDANYASGFSSTSSVLPPANSAHNYPLVGGGTDRYDPTNLVHSKSLSFGLNWQHNIAADFHIENKARYSRNTADWNTGAVISVVPIDDVVTSFFNGTAFLPPGTYNYKFHNTGQPAATVASFFVPGPPFPVRAVVSNNLPNQSVLAKGVFTQAAFVQHYKSDNFVDQATLTKDWGDHHLALGGYLALAKLSDTAAGGGFGFSTLTNQPQMLDVTYTPNGSTSVYQLTDPGSGFGSLGSPFGSSYYGKQNQYSVFFGDTWKATPQLTIEAGGRYESIDYDVFTQTYNSFAGNPLAVGGVDGNPLTVYDNAVSTLGALLETKRSYRFFNYTGSIAYDVSSHFNIYARYTSGKKAPDYGTIAGINTPSTIATQFPEPQIIRQFEMGLKFHQRGLDLQLFPFYSQLSNVTSPQTFTYSAPASKVGQFYSPPPLPGTIKTYGVEISALGEIVKTLMGHAQITLQNPRSSGFTTYTQGPKGDGTDDIKNTVPEGDADNNPKVIIRAGLDWKPIPAVTLFGEFNYIGKRAANLNNAFYLPAYNTTDIGGTWNINKMFKLQLNVTNVFNQSGVLSWSRSGAILDSLDRQGLTKATYSPTGIYPIVNVQARAFFLTLGAKF